MGMEVTDEALNVLRRSLAMTGGSGGVRLRGARGLGRGFSVQVELADAPLPGEEVLEVQDVTIFVDPSVTEAYPDAVVTVSSEHENIVVLAADSS